MTEVILRPELERVVTDMARQAEKAARAGDADEARMLRWGVEIGEAALRWREATSKLRRGNPYA